MSNFNYKIISKASNSNARSGKIITPHGAIPTPNFIFCATKGAIKGASVADLKEIGVDVILSNTYHLMLNPGGDNLERLGGIHKLMGWDGPMLTDSGGFQIFSLGHGSVASEIKRNNNTCFNKTLIKLDEVGAVFRSYINGDKIYLTPEISMKIQKQIGADLVVVLDECTPFNVDKNYTSCSMHMSHRWALRSLEAFKILNEDDSQRLYGIIQGGIYKDLRRQSCDFVNTQNFFGFAVGGSLGSNREQMYDIVASTVDMLADNHPIHLLGIGGIKDIFNGVRNGIDTFDCVHPTRIARHGGALVRAANIEDNKYREHINLRNTKYKFDEKPLDEKCSCRVCKNHSRAYIHYLLKANELLSLNLITYHNIAFITDLMKGIRSAIETDSLNKEEKKWIAY